LNTSVLNSTVLIRHNSMIESRGGLVCPSGCACTPLAACGADYVPVAPSPPSPPSPLPPPSPSSTCNYTSNVNLGRPGRKVGHASKMKSKQECCDACGREPKCRAAHIDADGTGTCWLWSSSDLRPGNGTACVPDTGESATRLKLDETATPIHTRISSPLQDSGDPGPPWGPIGGINCGNGEVCYRGCVSPAEGCDCCAHVSH
jgi:hypothetical protein